MVRRENLSSPEFWDRQGNASWLGSPRRRRLQARQQLALRLLPGRRPRKSPIDRLITSM